MYDINKRSAEEKLMIAQDEASRLTKVSGVANPTYVDTIDFLHQEIGYYRDQVESERGRCNKLWKDLTQLRALAAEQKEAVTEKKGVQNLISQLEEIADSICCDYCKYPVIWDPEVMGGELYDSQVCADCPLGRITGG